IVVEQQLGLAVLAKARARDVLRVGAELVLLHADRSEWSRWHAHASHGAVGSASAHHVACTQAGDRPQSVAIALDGGDVLAEEKLGAARPQQEIVKFEPTNEPAVAIDGAALAAVANVAGLPFPAGAGIGGGRKAKLVPNRRRQPARAKLHAREGRAIHHRDFGTTVGEKASTGAARRTSANYDNVENLHAANAS